MKTRIELHKERDFSAVLGDAVKFVKQNFKQMGINLVLLVVPPFVLASVAFGLFFVNLFAQTSQLNSYGGRVSNPNAVFAIFSNPLLWLTMLFYFATALLAIASIFIYIKIYSERTDDSKITTKELFKRTIAVLPRFFFFTIGYFILFFIVYFVGAFTIGLLMVPLMMIPVLGIIIAVVTFIVLILFLATYFSILLPVILYEKTGFFETLGRTRTLLGGSMWQTVGIIFVAYILVMVFGLGLNIALQYILTLTATGSETFSPAILKILTIIYFVVSPIVLLVAYTFQFTVSSFTYFSLVEKKDMIGLNKQVESIGDTNAEKPEEQF